MLVSLALFAFSSAYLAGIDFTGSSTEYRVSLQRGLLTLSFERPKPPEWPRGWSAWCTRNGFRPELPWRPYHTAARLRHVPSGIVSSSHGLVVPLWPFPLAACGLGLYGHYAVRRARRGRHGCPTCGYDLSGLPAGAPCPECGAGRTERRPLPLPDPPGNRPPPPARQQA